MQIKKQRFAGIAELQSYNHRMIGQIREQMAFHKQRGIEDKHVQLSYKSKEQMDFEAEFHQKQSKEATMQNNLQNQQRIVELTQKLEQMDKIERQADKQWVNQV